MNSTTKIIYSLLCLLFLNFSLAANPLSSELMGKKENCWRRLASNNSEDSLKIEAVLPQRFCIDSFQIVKEPFPRVVVVLHVGQEDKTTSSTLKPGEENKVKGVIYTRTEKFEIQGSWEQWRATISMEIPLSTENSIEEREEILNQSTVVGNVETTEDSQEVVDIDWQPLSEGPFYYLTD